MPPGAVRRLNGFLTYHGQYTPMSDSFSVLIGLLLKSAAVLLAANEARGLILAGPVLYAMYETGGTLMAIWLGFCSLGGIALSVIVPLVLAKKVKKLRFAN